MNPAFADELVRYVASAIATDCRTPGVWRGVDERTLARRVVGAIDTHAGNELASIASGAEAGHVDVVHASPDDDRVAVLERVLAGWNWRGFTPEQLGRHLVASLQVLQADWMISLRLGG